MGFDCNVRRSTPQELDVQDLKEKLGFFSEDGDLWSCGAPVLLDPAGRAGGLIARQRGWGAACGAHAPRPTARPAGGAAEAQGGRRGHDLRGHDRQPEGQVRPGLLRGDGGGHAPSEGERRWAWLEGIKRHMQMNSYLIGCPALKLIPVKLKHLNHSLELKGGANLLYPE